MPALAHTNPWLVSVMTRSPRRRRIAHRLLLDQRLVGERVVGVDRHEPVLGLGHDLLGDDHHVAVGQVVRLVAAAAAMMPARSSPDAGSRAMPSSPNTSAD